MSIVNILLKMPWWYIGIIILFTSYYVFRGITEQHSSHKGSHISKTQKVVIFYIQEFLFKSIFTISSFIALFINGSSKSGGTKNELSIPLTIKLLVKRVSRDCL